MEGLGWQHRTFRVSSYSKKEGLRIPPIKILEKDKDVEAIFDILRNNTRTPYFIDGDIRVFLGVLNEGKRHFIALITTYGEDLVAKCMEESLNYTERRMRKAIRKLPNGIFAVESYLDSGEINNSPIYVTVKLIIDDGEITVDFTGSSVAVDIPVNYSFASTCSGVYFGLKLFLDPLAPTNAGTYRKINIIIPKNTVFNPEWPAPVYCGKMIPSEKVAELIWVCLENAIPEQVIDMPYLKGNTVIDTMELNHKG